MTTRTFTADDLIRIRGAVAWRPDPGAEIEGTVFVIVPRESDYGRYPVVVLEDLTAPTGPLLAVHGFHSLLEDQLRTLAVKPGDEIRIRYVGKQESKTDDGRGGKRSYHNYIVIPATGADLEIYDYTDTPSDVPAF